jgi:hypothetical protein
MNRRECEGIAECCAYARVLPSNTPEKLVETLRSLQGGLLDTITNASMNSVQKAEKIMLISTMIKVYTKRAFKLGII